MRHCETSPQTGCGNPHLAMQRIARLFEPQENGFPRALRNGYGMIATGNHVNLGFAARSTTLGMTWRIVIAPINDHLPFHITIHVRKRAHREMK